MARAMRPLLLAASLLLVAATAHADAAGPPSCISPPGVGPAPGSTIPANLPAFLFQPGSYPSGLERPIESFKLGIAEVGQMVPVVVEGGPDRETLLGDGAGAYVWYLVKPERPLRQGEVFLRFDDVCGLPTQPITPPMRRDVPYTAGPPLPLPTRLGTATQTPAPMDPAWGRRMIGVQVRLDPALAAFPLLRIEVRAPDGRPLSAALMRRQPDLVEGALVLDSGPAPANSRYLRPGESTVTFSGEVLGGEPLPPVTLVLQTGCGADAGCALPDAASDGAISDGATAAPDLAAADRPREADAELASDAGAPSLTRAGCSCTTGGAPPTGAWLLAMLLAPLVRRRRAAQKLPDSTMPPPSGVTTGATRSSRCSSRRSPACGRGRPARARRSSL